MSGWMKDLPWLRERRAALILRISRKGTEQDPDGAYLASNHEKAHGRRNARRDALAVINSAISEAM